MMLFRPEGLFPSQRRRQELHVAEELDDGLGETTDVPVGPPSGAAASPSARSRTRARPSDADGDRP